MWILNYFREVRAELSHVTWPTPRQAVVYTVIVVAISLILAAYLGVLDFGFEALLKKII
jgi:preprotein translocase subunit SecE